LTILVLALTVLLSALMPAQAQDNTSWFEADSLNAGLGPAPRWLDRTTPQGTMESFRASIYKGDYTSAAHLLDLSDIPDPQQPTAGPELAGMLNTLLARKVIIDWKSLSDRPDGILAHSANAPDGPERSVLIWSTDLPDRTVPIRLNRIKTPEGDPVWVFSRQTVGNLPALIDEHGPSELEKYLPEPLRKRSVGGLFVWEILAVPIVAGLAIILGIIVHRVLSWLAHRSRGRLATAVIRSI
ncbi:unnamed protein product, partial [Ectocarpus sp. 12 AP-2014]